MVYCSKCGTENPDDSSNCSKCGAPLNASQQQTYEYWGPRHAYRYYHRRGSIWGILIGAFILLIGVSILLGINFWNWIWPGFLIILGLMIIGGAVRRGRW